MATRLPHSDELSDSLRAEFVKETERSRHPFTDYVPEEERPDGIVPYDPKTFDPNRPIIRRIGDHISDPVRESNGAKAARQAAEHVTELEQELEKARYARDECKLDNHNLQVSLDRLREEFERLRAERDHYMLQYNAIKQSLNEAATVILNCLQREGVDRGTGS